MEDFAKRSAKEWTKGVGVAWYLLRDTHATHLASSPQEVVGMVRRLADPDRY